MIVVTVVNKQNHIHVSYTATCYGSL